MEDVHDAAANGKPYYACGNCSADCADRLVQIFAKKRADDLRMLFNRAFLPLGHDLIQPARALHLQPHLTEHTDDALAAGVFGKRGGVLCAGLLCIM